MSLVAYQWCMPLYASTVAWWCHDMETLSSLLVFVRGIPIPDSKVHGANMGPIWGRQDPAGPHVGPMNFVIWYCFYIWAYMEVGTEVVGTAGLDHVLAVLSFVHELVNILKPSKAYMRVWTEVLVVGVIADSKYPRIDTFVSDRYLTDIDPRAFAIWNMACGLFDTNPLPWKCCQAKDPRFHHYIIDAGPPYVAMHRGKWLQLTTL